jgi:protein TonB
MKRKKEEVPGFDEIIFENRNKEYGAYDLRKSYKAATCYSIFGVVAFSTALILILSFSMSREMVADTPKTLVIVRIDPTLLDPNKVKTPEEPARPKADTYKPSYVAPEIVEKVDSTDTGMLTTSSIDQVKNRPVDTSVVIVNNTDNYIPVEPAPFVSVEEMPKFPGGDAALLKFLAEAIKYPEDAIANGLEGRVTLRFVVSSDGSVKQVEILRGVHPVLDTEAIRVVSTLPKWTPGKQGGKPVPVYFTVPVSFKLKFN